MNNFTLNFELLTKSLGCHCNLTNQFPDFLLIFENLSPTLN